VIFFREHKISKAILLSVSHVLPMQVLYTWHADAELESTGS
jgi:hypothetical protein